MSADKTDPGQGKSGDITPEFPILDVFDAVHRAHETPMQIAAREMLEGHPELDEQRRLDEADRALEDIDEYVQETNPEGLAEAEAQLAEWKLPEDPLENIPDFIPEDEVTLDPGPLVNVFDLSSVLEGSIIQGILNAEGIACIVDNFTTNPPAGVFGQAGSWGRILVGENFAAQAKMAIEAAQQAESEPETGA